MKLKPLKILSAIFIMAIGLSIALYNFLVNDYWKFDRKYINEIEQFEYIHELLKGSSSGFIQKEFQKFPKKIFLYTSEKVDFTITKKNLDFLKTKSPKIYTLLESNLAYQIIKFKDENILFYLKDCERPNCIKDNGGFFGHYVHYLSKDQIEFKNTPYSKIVDSKKIGSWIYYIIWYSKG